VLRASSKRFEAVGIADILVFIDQRQLDVSQDIPTIDFQGLLEGVDGEGIVVLTG